MEGGIVDHNDRREVGLEQPIIGATLPAKASHPGILWSVEKFVEDRVPLPSGTPFFRYLRTLPMSRCRMRTL